MGETVGQITTLGTVRENAHSKEIETKKKRGINGSLRYLLYEETKQITNRERRSYS